MMLLVLRSYGSAHLLPMLIVQRHAGQLASDVSRGQGLIVVGA
jgi:hypothetical protein